jgi:hypothetical protein
MRDHRIIPVRSPQSLMVPSAEPDAWTLPLGLKLTPWTQPECPQAILRGQGFG